MAKVRVRFFQLDIEFLNNKLALDTPCWNCQVEERRGEVYADTECKTCKGVGWMPTANGERILLLVKDERARKDATND